MIYVISGLCFIIIFAVLLCFKLLVKDFKFWHGILACLLGIVVVIPIAFAINFIQSYEFIKYENLRSVLINAILFNGLIEESFKMLILFLFPSKKMQLPEFFACALLTGISIGCFEMILYFVIEPETTKLILRLITSVLIHMSCSGLSGLFVYSCRHKTVKVLSYIFAMLLHGVYNYFAGFGSKEFFHYISIVVILFALLECRIRYQQIKNLQEVPVKTSAKNKKQDRTMLKIKGTNDKTIVSVKKEKK